ncbi:YcaQ family DNA glycosylase [Phototrophicus methaneseepsis]|uniref:YcaQ family DNA glycosylase n=1 Tax=Phototrophicus methaneseepsis TaxID=2710758 RepID=A0A7S8E8Q8_9CHLR|nr:crosslink repair DNA glycosylase YcaQ family protein [Phototrophicus methaneseepsis]QPC82427.1 YcaQ family DNA glycosylase [Phototrophicus methaneseepsis]
MSDLPTGTLKLTNQELRRLVIVKQHLSAAEKPTMLDTIRDIGCLQLDPISAVERSHMLVLWSRIGPYDEADLNKLIYEDRALFEYWAHVASIVPTQDYPLHQYRMERYPRRWYAQFKAWWDEVEAGDPPLSQYVLATLRENGPMNTKDFEDKTVGFGPSSGWTSGRNINRMMDMLWAQGKVMVTKRRGKQRYWDLAERCLPEWAPRETRTDDEHTYLAAQRAIKSLGAATARQINLHFVRDRYPNLQANLDRLVTDERLIPVEIEGQKGNWYMHTDDLPVLENIRSGGFQPRTTLLSPFDNLICDRDRTEQLWNFYFRIEIYVPKDKREFGYYVLPILYGDDLIGRIDPKFDRKSKTLHVYNIYAEDDAPDSDEVVDSIFSSIQSLARFLGANQIVVENVPQKWAKLRQNLA